MAKQDGWMVAVQITSDESCIVVQEVFEEEFHANDCLRLLLNAGKCDYGKVWRIGNDAKLYMLVKDGNHSDIVHVRETYGYSPKEIESEMGIN